MRAAFRTAPGSSRRADPVWTLVSADLAIQLVERMAKSRQHFVASRCQSVNARSLRALWLSRA
jgi:hypothetical protein